MDRELNIVFSIGKTASTSLYKTWAASPENLPVVHTHSFTSFCVVDNARSLFSLNVLANHSELIYGVFSLPGGLMEFRFTCSSVAFDDIFPPEMFSAMRVVGVVRDPFDRRISQFLNTLTVENMNATLDAAAVPCERMKAGNVLEQLKRIGKVDIPCGILKKLLRIALDEGRLLTKTEVKDTFREHFVGTDLCEYVRYLEDLKRETGVEVDVDSLRGGSCVGRSRRGITPTRVMIVKMESLKSAELLGFMGVEGLRHDRAIETETSLVGVTLASTQALLQSDFSLRDLYPLGSAESKLVARLGLSRGSSAPCQKDPTVSSRP